MSTEISRKSSPDKTLKAALRYAQKIDRCAYCGSVDIDHDVSLYDHGEEWQVCCACSAKPDECFRGVVTERIKIMSKVVALYPAYEKILGEYCNTFQVTRSAALKSRGVPWEW